MIRYTARLKGTGVYSDNMSVSQTCEHDQCTQKAEYTIMGDHWDSDPTYVCETHLERKEFILQGRSMAVLNTASNPGFVKSN